MANATNSTPGSVQLAGALGGNNDATAPAIPAGYVTPAMMQHTPALATDLANEVSARASAVTTEINARVAAIGEESSTRSTVDASLALSLSHQGDLIDDLQSQSGVPDTGWIVLTLAGGYSTTGTAIPAYRIVGRQVYLRGTIVGATNTSGVTPLSAVLPSAARPPVPVIRPVTAMNGALPIAAYISVSTAGVVEIVSAITGNLMTLDGPPYFHDA